MRRYRLSGSIPQNARTGAVITVESFVGAGARWTYWSQDVLPSLPLGAILYWLADHLAGAERRTLQADPQAARLAAQCWPVIQPCSFIRRCR